MKDSDERLLIEILTPAMSGNLSGAAAAFEKAKAEIYRSAIKAIESESWHMASEEQVDIATAMRERFISAIRNLME